MFYGPDGDLWNPRSFPAQHGNKLHLRDFPNLAPPFPNYFIEYVPMSTELKADLRWFGAHITSVDPADLKDFEWTNGAAWCVNYDLYCFINEYGKVVGPLTSYFILLDEAGQALSASACPHATNNLTEEQNRELLFDLGPAFLTTSLMHCKNVATTQVQHPSKLARRTRRGTVSPW